MRALALFAFLITPGWSYADCATDAEIAAFVASAKAKQPAKALGVDGTMEEALCTQAKLAVALEPTMGRVIGYKAGLTSKPAQDRFGATEPVQGLLFEKMMLNTGATVPTDFGAIPMVEADLVMVVGDDAINEATTPGDVMSNISAVFPFIELPDLTVAQGEPINAVTLTAMGVAPKLGVLGSAVIVNDPAEMTAALENMVVTLRDGSGEVIVTAPGKSVLGNPANSVLWLMSKGITLQKGDLISVGSFGPLTPAAKMKGGASATYTGLPGDPVVTVQFTK